MIRRFAIIDENSNWVYNIGRRERRLDSRGFCRKAEDEESPSTAEQGCQLTAGGGDSKASATEIYRQAIGKGGKVR